MTQIEELIEYIETHGNSVNDGKLTVNDIYKYAQNLQLQQTGVIKSVCPYTEDNRWTAPTCLICGRSKWEH